MMNPSFRSLCRLAKPDIEPSLKYSYWRRSQSNRRTGHGFPFACHRLSSLHMPHLRTSRDDDAHRTGRDNGQCERYAVTAPLRLQPSRSYHTSPANERAVAIMLGLGAVSAASYGASAALKAYNEFKASLPDVPTPEEQKDETMDQGKEESAHRSDEAKAEAPKGKPPDRENIFVKWFNMETGYYEGGFEETMTKQEAALILGIRQSSSATRIKEAHRKLLILNHPDTGGSTYLSGKINEAKEILLKGKRGEK